MFNKMERFKPFECLSDQINTLRAGGIKTLKFNMKNSLLSKTLLNSALSFRMSPKQTGGADRKQEEKPGGGRSRGDPGRRAASEGGEESRRLRWRINQLEKEKLKLTSSCNQEVRRRCRSVRLWFCRHN